LKGIWVVSIIVSILILSTIVPVNAFPGHPSPEKYVPPESTFADKESPPAQTATAETTVREFTTVRKKLVTLDKFDTRYENFSASISEIGSQSPLTHSNVISTYKGKVDVSKLPQLSQLPESAKVFKTFEIPFLTQDFSHYNQMKSQIPVNLPQNNFVDRQPQMGLVERQLASTQSPEPQSPEPQSPFSLLTAFEGLTKATSGNFIPPDTQVAAGPNDIMEMVNTHAKIWTKQGVPINDFSLQAFFGLSAGVNPVDPKIMYDAISGRWFATAFVQSTSTLHLAVSVTSNPNGSWVLYTFTYGSRLCPDQPKIGVSDDKFVISVNIFTNLCGGGTTFLGPDILVFKKSELLSGASQLTIDVFALSDDFFGPYPAQSMSSSSTVYLGSSEDADLNLVTFYTITGTVPGTILNFFLLPIATSILPPNAVQAGSAFLINTGDNRIQSKTQIGIRENSGLLHMILVRLREIQSLVLVRALFKLILLHLQ